MRNQQDAIHEARFADIRDPTIDDDTRIKNLVDPLSWTLAPENPAECRQIQQVTLIGAGNEADVGHHEQDEDFDERYRVLVVFRGPQDMADHHRPDDPQDRPDRSPDEALERRRSQPALEVDDGKRPDKAEPNRGKAAEPKRLHDESSAGERYRKDRPNHNDVQHITLLLLDLNIQFGLGCRRSIRSFGFHASRL